VVLAFERGHVSARRTQQSIQTHRLTLFAAPAAYDNVGQSPSWDLKSLVFKRLASENI